MQARAHRLEQRGDFLRGGVEEAGLDRPAGARLRRGGLGHHGEAGETALGVETVGGRLRRHHIHRTALRPGGQHGQRRQRRRRRARAPDADGRLGGGGAAQESGDGVLLGLQRIGGRFETVLGPHQRAVQFVIGNLQVGDAAFIGLLHLLIAMVLGGDDAVLEDHIDGGERHPAQEDQGQSGQRRLQRRPEGEELHPAVAADINLTFRESLMNPRPDALEKRRRLHLGTLLGSVLRARTATGRHFTRRARRDQAFVPEKRARG